MWSLFCSAFFSSPQLYPTCICFRLLSSLYAAARNLSVELPLQVADQGHNTICLNTTACCRGFFFFWHHITVLMVSLLASLHSQVYGWISVPRHHALGCKLLFLAWLAVNMELMCKCGLLIWQHLSWMHLPFCTACVCMHIFLEPLRYVQCLTVGWCYIFLCLLCFIFVLWACIWCVTLGSFAKYTE